MTTKIIKVSTRSLYKKEPRGTAKVSVCLQAPEILDLSGNLQKQIDNMTTKTSKVSTRSLDCLLAREILDHSQKLSGNISTKAKKRSAQRLDSNSKTKLCSDSSSPARKKLNKDRLTSTPVFKQKKITIGDMMERERYLLGLNADHEDDIFTHIKLQEFKLDMTCSSDDTNSEEVQNLPHSPCIPFIFYNKEKDDQKNLEFSFRLKERNFSQHAYILSKIKNSAIPSASRRAETEIINKAEKDKIAHECIEGIRKLGEMNKSSDEHDETYESDSE